jgi:hypothetical protein
MSNCTWHTVLIAARTVRIVISDYMCTSAGENDDCTCQMSSFFCRPSKYFSDSTVQYSLGSDSTFCIDQSPGAPSPLFCSAMLRTRRQVRASSRSLKQWHWHISSNQLEASLVLQKTNQFPIKPCSHAALLCPKCTALLRMRVPQGPWQMSTGGSSRRHLSAHRAQFCPWHSWNSCSFFF